MIQYLKWDSDFFQKKVGSIFLNNESNLDLENLLNFDLVYIIVNETIDSAFLHNNPDFLLVDNKITYSKKIITTNQYDFNIKIMNPNDKITKQIHSIAIQSGNYSRFKLDPNISEQKFNELYSIWIDNSVNRKIAREVLVFQNDECIYGLITLDIKKNKTDIGLIAVDQKYRGNRIGTKLLEAADFWSIHNFKIEEIQVTTQEANIEACSFYEKNGFTISRKQQIFHWWKKRINDKNTV